MFLSYLSEICKERALQYVSTVTVNILTLVKIRKLNVKELNVKGGFKFSCCLSIKIDAIYEEMERQTCFTHLLLHIELSYSATFDHFHLGTRPNEQQVYNFVSEIKLVMC